MTSFYKQTKYPNIFKNTYWGGFDLDDHNNMHEIFNNRNQFIQDFKIKKINTSLKNTAKVNEILSCLPNSNGIDHLEIYEDIDKNIIVVLSPYMDINSNDVLMMNTFGFKNIYQLYFKDAISFVMKIQK